MFNCLYLCITKGMSPLAGLFSRKSGHILVHSTY